MGFSKFTVCSFHLVVAFCSIRASPVQINGIANGIAEFTRDLHSQCVKTKPGNIVLSPLSIVNSLALLAQASNGKTFEELRSALHLSSDKKMIADQLLDHRIQIGKDIGNATLPLVTRIYVQEGQQLNTNFQIDAMQKFSAGVESINFAESAKSAQTINQFVEDITKGKVKDLIKQDQLSADTRSALVNAVYFKGVWEHPFQKESTRKRDFYNSETEKVPVDFMYVNEEFNYANLEDLGAKAIELKFANSSISFVIVLPIALTGISAVETKLKTYDWAKITENMDTQSNLDVVIPKFKIEYEVNLKDVLRNLGVNEIFSDGAGLNGILESGESLKVSNMVHKATFEIDEKGAEAAAGTGFTAVPVSIPPQFNADHPFVYYIRESKTNSILFSGHIEHF